MTRLPAQVEWIPGRILDRPGHRLLVILAAPGCSYSRKTGGCTNCGFVAAFGTGQTVSSADLSAQLETALAGLPADAAAPVGVELFCSGSFFNDAEIPADAQASLLTMAARHPATTAILVETRPGFVTPAALERGRQAVRGKHLEVAIGLESADAEIREQRIKKGFTWEQFVSAARLVAQAGAAMVVYVLLKPIDTGERAAIADAVKTAERVFELGKELGLPTRVALEPCFVAPQTPLFLAFREGRYRPPWLWSVAEAAMRIAPLGAVLIGLSDEGLNPERSAHNCGRCSHAFREALAEFNRTQDRSRLEALSCTCREEWIAKEGDTG